MTKSIEEIKSDLKTLKQLYELRGIDIPNIKEVFDLYYNAKIAIIRNREKKTSLHLST